MRTLTALSLATTTVLALWAASPALAGSPTAGAAHRRPAQLPPDVPEGHWASASIRRLIEAGILPPTSPDRPFSGDAPATGADVASLVGQLLRPPPAASRPDRARPPDIASLKGRLARLRRDLDRLRGRVDAASATTARVAWTVEDIRRERAARRRPGGTTSR